MTSSPTRSNVHHHLPASATEPTSAFQTDSTALLKVFNLAPTSVATASLAQFYPASILDCPTVNSSCDSANNYTSAAPITGYSYNGVGKMDFVITPKHTLALRMFGGQGNQVAPVGTLNPYFFEQGPIHVYNWSAVVNSVLTPRFTNQVLLGVNYFNQIFFDDNHSMNPISFGFNTGAAQATAYQARPASRSQASITSRTRHRRQAAMTSPVRLPTAHPGSSAGINSDSPASTAVPTSMSFTTGRPAATSPSRELKAHGATSRGPVLTPRPARPNTATPLQPRHSKPTSQRSAHRPMAPKSSRSPTS